MAEPAIVVQAQPPPMMAASSNAQHGNQAQSPKVGTALPGWDTMASAIQSDFDAAKAASKPGGQRQTPPAQPAAATGDEPSPDDVDPDAPAAPAVDPNSKVPELPAVSKNWRKMKEKFEKEKADLRAELEAARKGSPASTAPAAALPPEFATLKAERDALQAQLRTVAAERDPVLQAQFKQTNDFIEAQAKAILGPDKGAAFTKLVQLPDGDHRAGLLDALFDEVTSNSRKIQLGQLITQADRLANDRAALTAKGEQAWIEMQAQQKASMEQSRAQLNTRFDTVLGQYSDPVNGVAAFQAATDAEKGEVQELVTQARTFFSGQLTPDDLAKVALHAAALPRVIKSSIADKQRIATLEAEIGKLRGNSPGVRPAGGEGGDTPHDPKADAKVGYAQGLASALQQAGHFGGR